jgi:hypothetical protein
VREFRVVDPAERCAKCGKHTTVMFTGRVCSQCAGVWSPAQLAAIERTLRNPYSDAKPRPGRYTSREDRYKVAPGSKQEELSEQDRKFLPH